MRDLDVSARVPSRSPAFALVTKLALAAPLALAACGAAPSGSEDPPRLDLYGEPNAAEPTSNSSADEPRTEEASTPRVAGCPAGHWCSSLYAPSWKPGAPADADGRFLHDFSYAGYHAGEAPPVSPPGGTFDVTRYGADASGAKDTTSAVTAAIAAASSAGGGVVFFPAGTYRVDGTLDVRTSGVVLRGAGTSSVLRFTNTAGMGNKAHLSFVGAVRRDAPRKLVADAANRDREIAVDDASDLAPGDDVAVGWTITDAFVADHGMTGVWTSFSGRYEPFFRSKVVSVDTSARPNKVVLDAPLRYAVRVRDGAGLQKESGYLREVGLEHLAVSNATTWDKAWAQDHVNAIALRGVADAWVDDVHSAAAVGVSGATGMNASDMRAYHLASAGLLVEDAKRVSVLRSSMENPQNRGSGGNGYLFEVSRTNDVLFEDTVGRNGRHNFIQNWGFGNVGTVFLRCTSTGSEMLSMIRGKLTPEASWSDHHHSLAMATLVDSCTFDDGFKSENRGSYSLGAGHTATEGVVWNAKGTGTITSKQYGWGYVIGTHENLKVDADVESETGAGTAPRDVVEGRGQGATLWPASLYESQREKRLAR